MNTSLQFLLLKTARRLWFRATAFSAIAVAAALLALILKRYIPYDFSAKIGADAVGVLLNVLAASMLSVTIFSLSTLVSALGSATSNATPRVAQLMLEDNTAQNALATFIGSFLFSLVGIIALQIGLYGEEGRVILYIVTLAVIAIVVAMMLRWIDYVAKLGRVGEIIDRVEQAAGRALRERRRTPYLGGREWARSEPSSPSTSPSMFAVRSEKMGYLQHVDMAALQAVAAACGGSVHLARIPGDYVDTIEALAWCGSEPDDEQSALVRGAFTIDAERSFAQDPRFGISVMAEIASRALSPAVNDPGTAIDVLGRLARVLAIWAEPLKTEATSVRFREVYVPALDTRDLFDDAFTPIARDGAAMVEVALRVQKVLRILGGLSDPHYAEEARRHSALALARSKAVMNLEEDLVRVRVVASAIAETRA
mgnify:CR=1 FL=1